LTLLRKNMGRVLLPLAAALALAGSVVLPPASDRNHHDERADEESRLMAPAYPSEKHIASQWGYGLWHWTVSGPA
jgi:hypothetical protein